MERGMSDMERSTPTCARCGDPFLPEFDGQKYCSVTCRETAKKRRHRDGVLRRRVEGELLQETGDTSSKSLADLHDAATPPDVERQGDVSDHRTPERVAQDERFAAMIASEDADTPRSQRRSIPTALWERVRETLTRNPGVMPAEVVDARTDAARAAERAKVDRLRTTDPALRVQQRHDPSTRASVGLRGSQMRKLNTRNMPRPQQPPVWAIDDEDESLRRMEPGSTSDSPFFRGNSRASGDATSRHAAYSWRGLDDGFRF